MSLIADIKKIVAGAVNYANPMATIGALLDTYGIPTTVKELFAAYAQNKANNTTWTNGIINLILANHVEYKNPAFDLQKLADQLDYIETKILNPTTGQPYGFGEVDLSTGEVKIDGVVVKAGMDINALKRVNPTPDTAATNIWPWVLLIGLPLWLRKKRKNK